MDLVLNLGEISEFVIFILATLIAFISWLIKGLIEKPLSESKNTFNNFIERRIEILTEVKTRLVFITYFPTGKESLEYKEQLQKILLRDGKTAYLNKEVFDSVLRISIDPSTNEKLLLKTIANIDKDLYLQIAKIQDETKFYRKYSNYNPLKRFVGFIMLSSIYIASIFALILLIWLFVSKYVILKVIVIIIAVVGFYFINKWLER